MKEEKLIEKIRRHIDFFALQAIKQDFMFTKQFSDQTIAAAVIYAARQASNTLLNPWNEPAFANLFGSDLPKREVMECFEILKSAHERQTANRSAKSNKVKIPTSNFLLSSPHRSARHRALASCSSAWLVIKSDLGRDQIKSDQNAVVIRSSQSG